MNIPMVLSAGLVVVLGGCAASPSVPLSTPAPVATRPTCSGRIPSRTAPGTGAAVPITVSPQAMRPPSERMSRKFMLGAPMNPATKVLAGLLYSSIGLPTCSTTPARRTTILSASVMAST